MENDIEDAQPPKSPHFPTKEQLIEYIKGCEIPPTKRELAKAFRISGDDRIILKDWYREFKKDGILGDRDAAREAKYEREERQPHVLLEVKGINPSGQIMAVKIADEPGSAKADDEPYFLEVYGEGAPTPGKRVLVKIDEENPANRRARLVRVLEDELHNFLGIYSGVGDHGVVEPVSRQIKENFAVSEEHALAAEDGELVYCRILPEVKGKRPRHALRMVKVLERVGRLNSPKSASIIAIQNHDIPMEFSPEAIKLAEDAKPPTLIPGRVDLRPIPLVTIDGADARDFDDAVWAEPDQKVPGGWHLVVAIADVAHYVRFGNALDNEAFVRGNSVYFPDRVVPMLPEALSNGLCSLNPNEDRYCLAVHLWINSKGETTHYEFVRGLMNSRARLTYDQAQAAYDGEAGVVPEEILQNIIKPLYGVYEVLKKRRMDRGALDLDLPEHKVSIDPVSGEVVAIKIRERFESHKLIEECMIAANVAAAHAIENAEAPGIFRVHESPEFERIMDLRSFLQQMGYAIARAEVISAHHFNAVLEKVRDKPEAHVIHMAILRSQMAAYYSPKNLGHFGLSLEQYCHFTSPIRRYSDLIVHRTLINIFSMVDFKQDKLVFEQAENLSTIGTHISYTERRAMLAEREANERYITNFMSDKVGKEFDAIIASVNSFGMFVALKENGAQGLIPLRSVGGDFFLHDKERQRLIGRRTGEIFTLGQRVLVTLMEADTLTGSLRFALTGREMFGDSRNRRSASDTPLVPAERKRWQGNDRGGRDRDRGGRGRDDRPRHGRDNNDRGGRESYGDRDRKPRSFETQYKTPDSGDAPRNEERPSRYGAKRDGGGGYGDKRGGDRPAYKERDREVKYKREAKDPYAKPGEYKKFQRDFEDEHIDTGNSSGGGYRGNRDDGDRPKRSFDGPRQPREGGGGGYRGNRDDGDRPKRSFDGPRQPREGGGGGYRGNRDDGDRPKRSFDGPRRPRESGGGGYRGNRDDGDRPKRSFDGPRQPREGGGGGYRGNRDDGDRPKRSFDGDRPRAPRADGGRAFDGPSKPRGGGYRGNREDGERPRGTGGRVFDGPRKPRESGFSRNPDDSDRPRRAFDGPRKPREGGERPRSGGGGPRSGGGDRPRSGGGGKPSFGKPRGGGGKKRF